MASFLKKRGDAVAWQLAGLANARRAKYQNTIYHLEPNVKDAPGGLRDLIFADESPVAALGLLLFGFVVTFGSAAMGSAIMAAGMPKADDETPRGPPRLVAQALNRAGRG